MSRPPNPVEPVIPRPVAGPANVFAPSTAGNDLSQIASALQGIAPSLSRYAVDEGQRRKEQNTREGEHTAKVLEETRLDYAEAVKKGLIEPNDNPWFRYGLRRQQGLTSAMKYQRELTAAAQELPEEATLADFENFEREWFESWKADNIGETAKDESFTQGFANAAAQARQGVALQFAQRANDASLKLFEQGVQQRVNAVLSALTSSSEDEDYALAAKQVNSIIAESVVDNPRFRSRTTALLTDALAVASLDEMNPDIYAKVAAGLRTGTGAFDGITSVAARGMEVRQLVLDAQDRADRAETVRRQRTEDNAYRGAISALAEQAREVGGRWDLVNVEPIAQALEEQEGLAGVALNVRKWASEYREARFDAEGERTYKQMVYEAGTVGLSPKEVWAAAGRLKPEWVQNLLSLSESAGNVRPYVRRARSSPMYQFAEEAVRRTFANSQYADAGHAQGQTLGALLLSYGEFLKPYEAQGDNVFPTDAEVAGWMNANFTAIVEANAGLLRNEIVAAYQGVTGTKNLNIADAVPLPAVYERSVARKLLTGQPFSPAEIRLLKSTYPGIDPVTERDRLEKVFDESVSARDTAAPKSP
jgi:hypothetical protein